MTCVLMDTKVWVTWPGTTLRMGGLSGAEDSVSLG